GVTNMRLSVSSDTIKLEIKPFVLQVDPLQFQEEIKYLHSHMKSGTILPHVEGIYFKSNVDPLTFHADHEFKQKVVKMAVDAGMGQEEFLLQAVKSYIKNLEQQ
ncbi:excisionase, partial [Bacillus toyonensis]